MNIAGFAGILFSVLVMGFNCAMFIVIKFNDMRHLTKDVAEIKTDLKTLIISNQKQEVEIATQKEHCKIMHKRGRRNKLNKENIE